MRKPTGREVKTRPTLTFGQSFKGLYPLSPNGRPGTADCTGDPGNITLFAPLEAKTIMLSTLVVFGEILLSTFLRDAWAVARQVESQGQRRGLEGQSQLLPVWG